MAYDPIPTITQGSQKIVPTIVASYLANTTGNITTSSTSITATDLTGVGSVTVQISGTHAGINMIFETLIDGGSVWQPIQGMNQSTNALTTAGATGVITTNASVAWTVSPLLGQSQFRVRSTAFTSGSGAIVIHPSVQFVALPVATQAVSGTVATTMAANATTTPAKARDAVAGAADTGIPPFFIRRDTPTTVTPVAGDFEVPQIDSMGAQWVREKSSTVSTTANVAGSATNVTLLALNAQRRGASIANDSAAILYLKLGATASTTSYTVKMNTDDYYEVPANYTGIIDGIWASATGSARVTEVTS